MGPRLPSHPDAEPLLWVLVVFLLYTSLFFGVVALDLDSGRDFVLADLLHQGRVLYRDVIHWYGPLAPWFHSLLFRLFGPSVLVLLLAGAGVSLGIVLLTYFLARRVLSPVVSAVAAILVVAHAVYGFNGFVYATPYSFSATYGLLFSLLALYSSLRSLTTHYAWWDFLSGTAAGLALTCKHEFALISLLILLAGLVLRFRRWRTRLWAAALAQAGPYCIVGGAFAAILFRSVTLAEFLENVYPKQTLEWRYFFETVQYWGPNVWTGIRESITGFVLNFAFIVWATCVGAVLLGLARRKFPPRKLLLALLAFAPLVIWQARYLWYYPLLLHAVVLGCVLAGRPASREEVGLLALAAAFFLMRVLPHPVTHGYYGLLYFIPSLITYLYLCFELATPLLGRFLLESHLRPAMTAVFLVCFVPPHFFAINSRWGHNTQTIATERGTIRVTEGEAAKARVVLEEIRRRTSPRDRILLIPTGSICYFLSNREPASRHLAHTLGQLLDGEPERQEIAQLSQAPPKLIVIDDFRQVLHIPGPVNTFGTAYNRELHRWIRQHYREVRTIQYQDRPIHFLVPFGP